MESKIKMLPGTYMMRCEYFRLLTNIIMFVADCNFSMITWSTCWKKLTMSTPKIYLASESPQFINFMTVSTIFAGISEPSGMVTLY